MMSMVDEYWNQLLNYSSTSINTSNNSTIISINEQRLKPIEEHWRQNVSRRGHGYYNKSPDDPVIDDLLSCLLTSEVSLNENIHLPLINPQWLNVAIGIILSVRNKNNNDRYSFTLTLANDSVLLSTISMFLEEWSRDASNKRIQSSRINISLSNDDISKTSDQSIYILEHILVPFFSCELIINGVYECRNCQSTIKIRSLITSIPVHVSKNGFSLERGLIDFFSATSSDLRCSVCNKFTIRHIEVLKWPPVLLININDSTKIAKHRKPPGMVSFSQFSSWNCIGCPSSSIYNLTCFSSSLKSSGGTETLVRATKVKKRWLTSTHRGAIGEGEQLRRLYTHCRECEFFSLFSLLCFLCVVLGILVFQRMYHSSQFNFIHAINQCIANNSLVLPDNISPCATLEELCRLIETHQELADLKKLLISNIKTSFYCQSCKKVSDSFQQETSQMHIFKLTSTKKIVAHPVVLKTNDENNIQQCCAHCNYSSVNAEMPVCKQVFLKCPGYLIVSV